MTTSTPPSRTTPGWPKPRFSTTRRVTYAGFLTHAAAVYAGPGVRIERVTPENAKNYRVSRDFAAAAAIIRARHKSIAHAALLTTWLDHYNLNGPHLGGALNERPATNAAGQYA